MLEHSSETRTLDYSVFAVPPPTSFVWLHNGAAFSGNQRVSVHGRNKNKLAVRGATREDAGNYTLIAMNSVGVGSLSLLLRVECKQSTQLNQPISMLYRNYGV